MRRARSVALALVLLLAACGARQPAPSPGPDDTPAPGPSATMSEEACHDAGGVARWDIGDGNVRCEPGETELGRIPVGIEGGICCRPIDEPD